MADPGQSGGWIVVCRNRTDGTRRYVGPFTNLYAADAERNACSWAAEMSNSNNAWEYVPAVLQLPPPNS